MTAAPVYLDHAATTFADEAVIRAMAECMRSAPYNASAAYGAAGLSRREHRLCRRQIAGMLGCDPAEIVFTSGGTEANNQAVRSFAGRHAVIAAIEHASVLKAAQAAGLDVTPVYPDKTGYIPVSSIEAALRPDTALICLQAASNETGVIQPVREAGDLARRRRIHLHVDAVQAFGHIPVHAEDCSSMSLSAHKLYGPRGAGALFVRAGSAVSPLLHGGGQESGLRAGTENTPAVCGFRVAAELAQADMALRAAREERLMSAFLAQLSRDVPTLHVLGGLRPRLPAVAALLIPGLLSEQAIAALDFQGIQVSGGAACAAGTGKSSHVYAAMGLSPREAACVLRVSIGRHTTQAQLEAAGAAIARLAADV